MWKGVILSFFVILYNLYIAVKCYVKHGLSSKALMYDNMFVVRKQPKFQFFFWIPDTVT